MLLIKAYYKDYSTLAPKDIVNKLGHKQKVWVTTKTKTDSPAKKQMIEQINRLDSFLKDLPSHTHLEIIVSTFPHYYGVYGTGKPKESMNDKEFQFYSNDYQKMKNPVSRRLFRSDDFEKILPYFRKENNEMRALIVKVVGPQGQEYFREGEDIPLVIKGTGERTANEKYKTINNVLEKLNEYISNKGSIEVLERI